MSPDISGNGLLQKELFCIGLAFTRGVLCILDIFGTALLQRKLFYTGHHLIVDISGTGLLQKELFHLWHLPLASYRETSSVLDWPFIDENPFYTGTGIPQREPFPTEHQAAFYSIYRGAPSIQDIMAAVKTSGTPKVGLLLV